MKNKQTIVTFSMVTGLLAVATGAQAQEIMARVISSTAVIQQVAVPRQQCTSTPVTSQTTSGAGALMGAIAGGAVGNAVGDGTGRTVATMLGLLGGAIVGNNIEGPKTQVQNVQQCSTVTTYENRTMHYDVVYEYADKRYSIQMLNDPGQFVRLQVSPIGILPPAGKSPQSYQQYQQPDAVVAQASTVYVQAEPVVVYPYVRPYVRPYISPYYAPIGMSLNLGYSGHRHWR
jgi:uncharacterized protein YcfJ